MKLFARTGHSLLLFFALGLFIRLSGTLNTHTQSPPQSPSDQAWVTIFVHGIISIKPHLTVTNFVRFLNDNVYGSPYGQTVTILRDNDFFYQNQPIQGIGLRPIDPERQEPGAAASCMAHLFEKVSALNAPQNIKNYYYTYGWSGLLSRSARCNDAKTFLLELEALVSQFRTQGIEPKIRIIGYSHGGTITLKLALAKRVHNLQLNFGIDEVYLVGTPVQFDTDYLIDDPFFKRVYNIFSRSDRVQKLDFFSCGQFFSDHVFKPHTGFEVLPDKLTQIEVRLIRKAGEGCKPLDACDADQFLLFNGKRCSKKIRNISPGHIELWFFGWTISNYRKTLPIYPIPIAAFTPFIINSIQSLTAGHPPEIPFIVTLDPRRDSMIVTDQTCSRNHYALPFIGIQTLLGLQNDALRYKPCANNFSAELFTEHIEAACQQAIAELKEQRRAEKSGQ